MASLIGGIDNAHAGAIHALEFNSREEYVLSGGQDRAVRLWNCSTGRAVSEYKQHAYEVLDIAVGNNDYTFASVGGDKTVFLWDVNDKSPVRRYHGHSSRINSVAFNDDGSLLATGSFDTTVKLWDCRSSQKTPLQSLDDAKDSISSIDVKDTTITTGSVDGKLRRYDIRNFKLYTDNIGPSITCVESNSSTTLVASLNNTVNEVGLDGSTVRQFRGHVNTQLRIGFATCRNHVIMGSEDDRLFIWEKPTAELVQTLHSGRSNHAIAGGLTSFACSANSSIQLYTFPDA